MSAAPPSGSVPAAPAPAYPVGPVLVPPESVPDRQGVMVCMSSTVRNGGWLLPRLFRALAIMGEVKLDLRDIRLAAGTSEIQVRAFMGSVKITVPHNLRVECDGTPFMGEFSVKRRSKSMPSPDAPLIRITGGAFMASVKVRIIDPQTPTALDRVRAWVNGDVTGTR